MRLQLTKHVLIQIAIALSSLVVFNQLPTSANSDLSTQFSAPNEELLKSDLLAVTETGIVNFLCAEEQGVPTVFVRTQLRRIPIISWSSDLFRRSGYNSQARCRQVAVRLQQFYNCEILDNLSKGVITVSRTGKTYPAIFANVKPTRVVKPVLEGPPATVEKSTHENCPTLKPDREGRLLLMMLEPEMNADQIIQKLDDIRVGIEDPVCDSCK